MAFNIGSPVKERSKIFENYNEQQGPKNTRSLSRISSSQANTISLKKSPPLKQLDLSVRNAQDKENRSFAVNSGLGSKIFNSPFLQSEKNSKPVLKVNNETAKTPIRKQNDSTKKNLASTQSPPKTISKPKEKLFAVNTTPNVERKLTVANVSNDNKKYFEFLCRVGEAKRWIEEVIKEELPDELELATGNAMRDGYFLAKLTQIIKPDLVSNIIPPGRLQFKHTQNINAFFALTDQVGVPDLFRFELTDLYEKKDLPKVFETLHALASILNARYSGQVPEILNLSGTLEFSEETLRMCKRRLPNVRNFRSFKSEGASFALNTMTNNNEGLIKDWTLKKAEATPEPNTQDDISSNYDRELNSPQISETQLSTPTNPTDEDTIVVAPKYELPMLDSSNIPELKKSTTFSKEDAPTTPEKQTAQAIYPSLRYTSPSYLKEPHMESRTASMLFSDPFLRTTNTNLNYNTHINRFSYYSPGISRRIAYGTELPYSPEHDYGGLTQYGYSYITPSYSPTRRQRMTESSFLDTLIKMQAYARGSNLRFELFIKRRKIDLFVPEIEGFIAIARGHLIRCRELGKIQPKPTIDVEALDIFRAIIIGNLYRNKVDSLRIKCLRNENFIRAFQNIAKAVLSRTRCKSRLSDVTYCEENIINLQSHIKGLLLRRLLLPRDSERFITCIQSITRGFIIRRRLNEQAQSLSASILQFQLQTRGVLVRMALKSQVELLNERSSTIVCLQGLCRSLILRRKYHCIVHYTADTEVILKRYQAKIRGNLKRQNLNSLQLLLLEAIPSIDKLVGLLKGYVLRSNMKLIQRPSGNIRQIILIQAKLKGILTRFAIELVDGVIERNFITIFQGKIRGAMLRSELRSNVNYYRRNLYAAIKLQSAIRAYQQHMAFNELKTSNSPGLWSVRKFVHLLNDREINDEISVLQLKKNSVNEYNKAILRLQSKVLKLAVKWKLLEKRGIDASNFMSEAGLKNLQKYFTKIAPSSVIERNSLYSQICYLLQVSPKYWKIMFKLEHKLCITHMPKLFSRNYGLIPYRENMLFINMIAELMNDDINQSSKDVFVTSGYRSSAWGTLLSEYLQIHKNAELNSLFSKSLVTFNNIKVDFESDPANIYQQLHPSKSPLASHLAIANPETRAKYVENMMNIWSVTESVRMALTNLKDEIPLEIRYLCTLAYRAISRKSSDEYDALRAVSKVLVEHVIIEFFYKRSNFGFEDKVRNMDDKTKIICDTLSTIFSLKDFTGFYEPLNSYVRDIRPEIIDLLRSMPISTDLGKEFRALLYKDIAAKEGPSLAIRQKYLDLIIGMFITHSSYLPQGDPIISLLKQMKRVMESSSSGNNDVLSLELEPAAYQFPLADIKSTEAYNKAKRGVCYLMQVEDVDTSITDLLTSEVYPEDDRTFLVLQRKYRKIRNDMHKNFPGINNYVAFKKHVIQLILELTQEGSINSSNNYQSLLADISNSIRRRNEPEITDEEDLSSLKSVCDILHQKREYLSLLATAVDIATTRTLKRIQKANSYTNYVNKGSGFSKLFKDACMKIPCNRSLSSSDTSHRWSFKQLRANGVLSRVDSAGHEFEASISGSSIDRLPDCGIKISTTNGENFQLTITNSRNRKFYYQEVVKFNDLLNKEAEDCNAELNVHNFITLRVSRLIDLLCGVYLRQTKV
ncbi:HER139Wp [Eremothecium sinecaudum]|uniref:HER139Wp n=1 Tax=Eremothecium sinecaudum TaxID=45286 RepID=A0A109UZE8_9SACH|nr:HER139Wp [Eremothecium sinecaudum]AMD21418.1 HER139Wp [Eremothecium sinecaudum]